MTNPPRVSPALSRPTRPMGRKLPKPPRAMPMGLPTGKRPVINTEILAKDVIEQIHRVRVVDDEFANRLSELRKDPIVVYRGQDLDLATPVPGVFWFEWSFVPREDRLKLWQDRLDAEQYKLQALSDGLQPKDPLRYAQEVRDFCLSKFKAKCSEACCDEETNKRNMHFPYCSAECADWDEKIKAGRK